MVIFEKKVCLSGMPGKKVRFAGNLLAPLINIKWPLRKYRTVATHTRVVSA